MIIEGTVKRQVSVVPATMVLEDPHSPNGCQPVRDVEIPFFIDTDDGTYSQWGHDTLILGENVELLEALRDAACEVVE